MKQIMSKWYVSIHYKNNLEDLVQSKWFDTKAQAFDFIRQFDYIAKEFEIEIKEQKE